MTAGVLILSGPTASGKTELALALARRFGAEIVGADSRQIYRGMPVGTAAPTARQQCEVPHHLVGFLGPQERYSAARFAADALAAIRDISARGRRAIVVGGTGFYIRALSGDVTLAGTYDEILRTRLAREAQLHSSETLHGWLTALDAKRASMIRASDRYRVLRALEVALARRGGARDRKVERASLRDANVPFEKVYLDVPIADLEARIAARVERMLEAGFVDEAERLGPQAVAGDAVGYPNALAYLRGFATREELRRQLYAATRRYAKRQATWFRSERDVVRVRIAGLSEAQVRGELERIALALPGWNE
ncbi:MAG: tRNA (adenosine(37)-N6)-dimethylallyltransferase MiaA [Candidatus Eremiobacteraeota bacterium]|nr:tRNA (adenosine(37)-N6)-dimethylallyltransferase MiaA [Candidatus Eremiobacteraeota bacterium]